MSPELAARCTAAAAALADYRRNADMDMVDRALWAERLAVELGGLLGATVTEDMESPDGARLAEIRALLAAFDWETDDRQYALEAIDRIAADGDSR